MIADALDNDVPTGPTTEEFRTGGDFEVMLGGAGHVREAKPERAQPDSPEGE